MSYNIVEPASQQSVLFYPLYHSYLHLLIWHISAKYQWLRKEKISKKFLMSPWNQQEWPMVPTNWFCLGWKYHFSVVISEYMNGTLTHDVLLKYCNVLLYFIFVENFLPKAQLGSGCFTFTSEAAHRLSGELILVRFSSDSVKCLHQKADEINGGRYFL